MKTVHKIALFLSLILIMQFITPAANHAFAEESAAVIQGSPMNNDFKMEFQAFPAGDIRAAARDNIAFVTAGVCGLMVFDIKDPHSPRQLAFLQLPEEVSLIGILGSYLYLPARNNIYIVDVADPRHPVYTSSARMYADEPLVGMAADADRIYLAGKKTITVLSAEDKQKPSYLTAFCPDNADEIFSISGLAARNGTVYAAMEDKGIRIYDFSQPGKIAEKGYYDSNWGIPSDVAFHGDIAYLSIPGKDILEILNISNIDKPEYKGTIKEAKGFICADGNTVFLVNSLGMMSIVGPQSPPAPVVQKVESVRNENKKTAYITIDDGPTRSITAMNLDTLKRYGIKATFFVLPHNGVDDVYKRILSEGHVIANHSYSHSYDKLYGSAEYFKADVLKAREYIQKLLGYTTTIFRFPGGAMGKDKDMIKERAGILTELGYRYYDWDVSTGDTAAGITGMKEEEAVKMLTDNVLKNTRDRKKLIILMHDSAGKMNTAKALPGIIDGLIAQGYTFDVLTNY